MESLHWFQGGPHQFKGVRSGYQVQFLSYKKFALWIPAAVKLNTDCLNLEQIRLDIKNYANVRKEKREI